MSTTKTKRVNYIDFVAHLYDYDVILDDTQILGAIVAVFNVVPARESLSVWKNRLRKKGYKIPDGRKKK